LSRIQRWLAKRAIFRPRACAYLQSHSSKRGAAMKSNNPWLGLLFLQGHIADQTLAQSLAQDDSNPAEAGTKPAGSLVDSLVLLGSRPMPAGFNLDIEEPLLEPETSTPVRGQPPRAMQVACQTCGAAVDVASGRHKEKARIAPGLFACASQSAYFRASASTAALNVALGRIACASFAMSGR
jgi:hypothetical protein